MLNTAPKNSGFTLIEIMIVVAIIGVMTILGIPSYRAWVQNTQIYNAAESAMNGLQKAKAEAVKQNTNISFTLLGVGPAWTPSWQISVVNPAAIIESSTGREGSKNVTSRGWTVDTVTGLATNTQATTVTFNNLGGVVASAASLGQIDFASATLASARNLRVTIGIKGVGSNIRVCDPDPELVDPSLTKRDPRAC